MFNEHFQSFFEQVVFQSTGQEARDIKFSFVGGGCINNTARLQCGAGVFFIKWNESAPDDMFATEVAGLELLSQCGAVKVPEVIHQGRADSKDFVLMQFLEPSRQVADYWEQLGAGLADLHRITQPQFGLEYDNYIGRLCQKNEPKDSWPTFFSECRLRPQVGLALYNGLISSAMAEKFEPLYQKLPDLFPAESPALLHGDLWSGNVHTGPDGHAWLIDPAVYFGHREMELAFTRLFGGFDEAFYQSYQAAFPLQPGWQDRVELCNLYPLLVHVNLFGSSYLAGVERTLNRFV